jgi:CO/xanthine dehydrogenase FAD-binding subunit
MRTPLAGLRLVSPRALAGALTRLRDDETLVPLAGATDLFVGLAFGALGAPAFLDLAPLRELRGIRRRAGGGVIVGALATFGEIARSPLVRRHVPILAEAARQIGGAQIQSRATLGGNVVNASPAADAVPVLAVADAVLCLASARGERRVPIGDFYTGYRRTARGPGELLVEIEIPPLPGRSWFRKVGTRAANAIAKVVLAGCREDGPSGAASVRLALGSVAPTVLRPRRAEEALAGGAGLAAAIAALLAEIAPIDDLRSTAAYRRQVSVNLLAQFWKETSS